MLSPMQPSIDNNGALVPSYIGAGLGGGNQLRNSNPGLNTNMQGGGFVGN